MTDSVPGKKVNVEEVFRYAFETRKFEIGLFWQRSLFFWGFIAAAFVAYAAITTLDVPDKTLLLGIACFGVVCSVAWTLANRGSKYWQGAWEAKLETFEDSFLGVKLFSEPYTPRNKAWWGEWRYSVSRLTIALSDFTVGLWVLLMIRNAPTFHWPICLDISVLMVIGTVLYVLFMIIFGRSVTKT